MRVLVTGAAGFIGGHLCDELEVYGHTVVRTDKRSYDERNLLHPGVFAGAVQEARPELVVHLAAQVGRLFGEADVRHTVRTNAEMTAAVAQVCGDKGVRLMYASTSEVYGDQGDALCEERGPFRLPHNLYGLSKRWGEEVCNLYVPPDHLTLMRFSMPYGTGVPPGRGRAALPNILWQAHTRQPIPIHVGAERSWCWIGDTVRAVRMLAEGGHTGAWNIGRDDDARPLRQLASIACTMTGAPQSLIKDVPAPPAQTVVKRLSTDKLRALGWAPTVDVQEGMRQVLEWVSEFDAEGRTVSPAA